MFNFLHFLYNLTVLSVGLIKVTNNPTHITKINKIEYTQIKI